MKRIWQTGVFGLLLAMASAASADVMMLPANQVLSGPPRWHDVENVFLDDALYAIDTCTSNKLDTFSIGLAEPTDTTGRQIIKVVLYAKARTHYPRAVMWLWPVFSGTAYRSGNLKIGTTETTFSFDITLQDSTLADTTWDWEDIAGLGIRYQARTTKVVYFVNHLFAAVTYVDTINRQTAHSFAFDPIATPETVGVAFPVGISTLDSTGALISDYNGTALISDLTGTVSPVMVTFAGGRASPFLTISDTLRNNFLVIDDGLANDTSGLFDVVNSGLHHFTIDSIGPQVMNVPFGISLSARDFFDDTVTAFIGQVDLWDGTGTMTPDSTGPFAGGTWSGSINIAAVAAMDTVFCSYYNGLTITGASNGFEVQNASGVSTDRPARTLPETFNLKITPNPTSGVSKLSFDLPRPGRVEVIVYNILGQAVNRRVSGSLASGRTESYWNLASGHPQGLYFVRATLDGKTTVLRKLLISK